MKTITLDEVAYNRLKAWKKGKKESFSAVIKRVLPEPGTLGSFVNYVKEKETHSLSGNDQLEQVVADRSIKKTDPWT